MREGAIGLVIFICGQGQEGRGLGKSARQPLIPLSNGLY